MRRALLLGTVAGAVGTIVLDAATYADMTLRGRPASGLPGEAVGRFAQQAGVPLGDGGRAENRKQGLGALLGYLSGVAIGVTYGLVRSVARPPLRVAGPALGVAAMVATSGPMTVTGLTDPRTWGLAGWVSDIVPHLAYGYAAAATYGALAGDR